jgi:hypothetical protein
VQTLQRPEQISAAAGLRLAGAVGYHLGDKARPISAIIEDRDGRIDKRRRSMLVELENTGVLTCGCSSFVIDRPSE